MILGVVTVAPGVATGGVPFTYYAATNGFPVNVPCTRQSAPCDLQTAMTTESTDGNGIPGSMIRLAAGVYKIPALVPTTGNDNVTIMGTGKKTVIAVTNVSTNNALVDLSTVTGVTLANVTIENAGAAPVEAVLLGSGNTLTKSTESGCGSFCTGVLLNGASGSVVSGDTIESNEYGVVVCAVGSPSGVPCGASASTGNTLQGNTWMKNSMCQIVDFTGGQPPDTYSSNNPSPAANSCAIGLTPYFGSAGGGAGVAAIGTLSCTGVTGRVTFNPPLVNGGTTSGREKVSVAVSACTTAGSNYPTPVTAKGTSSGKLVTNDCVSLLTGSTSMDVSDPALAVRLSLPRPSYSGVKVQANFGGGTHITAPQFGWSLSGVGTKVVSSFTGSDGGASSSAQYVSNFTLAQVMTACASPNGLKSLKITSGAISLE